MYRLPIKIPIEQKNHFVWNGSRQEHCKSSKMDFSSGGPLSPSIVSQLNKSKKCRTNVHNLKRNVHKTSRNSGEPYIVYKNKPKPVKFLPSEK